MTESHYQFQASKDAFRIYGKDYADYIEQHTQELIDKGYDVADRSLSEALVGNDGA